MPGPIGGLVSGCPSMPGKGFDSVTRKSRDPLCLGGGEGYGGSGESNL